MLTEKENKEVKEHLEKAQNPFFFFDNDSDGLSSFLLLQRHYEKGKGIPIRSFPEMDRSYFRKVLELNADYIFILDKPLVSKEFFEEAEKYNIPVVWIDHHELPDSSIEEMPEFVNYYNPIYSKKEKNLEKNEPVTEICYNITKNEKDLWLYVVGCISDNYLPEYYYKFKEKYPDLSIDSNKPSKIFYESPVGQIARIFNFALMDRTTNVIKMLKYLMKIKSPYEVLKETSENKLMHNRYQELNKKLRKNIEKAKSKISKEDNIVFFTYSGEISMSAEIANELSYDYPEKIVVVGYFNGMKTNISIRGKNAKKVVIPIIEKMEDATGGGHDEALGVKINSNDVEKFKSMLEEKFEDKQ